MKNKLIAETNAKLICRTLLPFFEKEKFQWSAVLNSMEVENEMFLVEIDSTGYKESDKQSYHVRIKLRKKKGNQYRNIYIEKGNNLEVLLRNLGDFFNDLTICLIKKDISFVESEINNMVFV